MSERTPDDKRDQVEACTGCGVVFRYLLKRQRWSGSSYNFEVPRELAAHVTDQVYATADVIGDGRVQSCRIVAGRLRLELHGTGIRDIVITLRKVPTA